MELVWDERKRLSNLDKHGLDFADLSLAFFETGVVRAAKSGRYKVANWFDGHAVTVIFAPLGTQALSIVSFRPAGANDRTLVR